MQQFKFDLAVDDVNTILEALGNLPYARVYTLVGKLQAQAARQMPTIGEPADMSPVPTGNGRTGA